MRRDGLGNRNALRRAGVAALLALSIAAFGRAASACSVCLAGDPQFSTHGSAAQERGQVAVYLELRDFHKTSGSVVSGGGGPDSASHSAAAGRSAPRERLAAPQPRSARAVPRHAGHEHEEEPPAPGGGAPAAGSTERSTRERNDGRRLDLYVAWTPFDRVTFTIGVPWAWNAIEEDAGGAHYSVSGLGDASLAVSGVVWRNRPVLPSTWIELRGWGKTPTGRDEQRVDGVLDPHVQTGTGSWDFGWGAAAAHRFAWGSVYASGFHRLNGEGGLDYEYGDVVLATAAVEAPLGHAFGVRALDRVTPGLALDFRWAAADRASGARVDDTGGAIAYLTPSVRIALPALGETHRAWLRTGVQIPLTDAWLEGDQDEGAVWSVGVGYGF